MRLCGLCRGCEVIDKDIFVALLGFAGSLLGSFGGIMGGIQLVKYQLKKQEEKQKALEEKQEQTDTEVINIKLSINTLDGKVKAQSEKIQRIETKQHELEKYHMKKE